MADFADFVVRSGMGERYFAMSSVPGTCFQAEAEELLARYREKAAGTLPIWLRFHLSDIANQAGILRQIVGMELPLVGQPPVNGSRLALEAYHLIPSENIPKLNRTASLCELLLENYRLLWFRREELTTQGSGPQMHEEFEEAEKLLTQYGGNIAENLQRTWIYCRDIDNNYAPLVTARRELFQRYGLLPDTHYIASTGIEGTSEPHNRLVRMDSFALFGHRPEQIEYMQALTHLSPTHRYGVTFERGTRIIYGDRSHYYISGTASIDSEGRIVYPGDSVRQAERLVDNVEALLENHGGKLTDLKQATVYLRDPADTRAVETVLECRLAPWTARIMVKGAVCRPGWLVEMDAIAVNENGNNIFRHLE